VKTGLRNLIILVLCFVYRINAPSERLIQCLSVVDTFCSEGISPEPIDSLMMSQVNLKIGKFFDEDSAKIGKNETKCTVK
jgi:hypothetical protein